jgi:hypothetical protein
LPFRLLFGEALLSQRRRGGYGCLVRTERARPWPANIRSLTSQGHPYAVFRRALDRKNATAALAAAADLPHVGLVDALELCLLLRDDGARFKRAIVRWQARYATETAGVTVEEALAVLALLAALRGPRAPYAARSLAELVYRRTLERACEVLIRWANQVDGVQPSG